MDNFLFIAFPYIALTLAIGVSIYRRLRQPYTYSSLSSEILEKRKLFWGSVPFHYGLTLVLLATTYMDGLILFVLLIQIGSGTTIAIFDRWGGLWYLHTAVPWFWSLATFRPELVTVVSLPAFVKLHFVVGFLVILLFPFGRLVHLVMLPLQYLWRPYQVVIWNPGSQI